MLRVSAIFRVFFNVAAPSEIYTLSLHDALPIYLGVEPGAEVPFLDDHRHAIVELADVAVRIGRQDREGLDRRSEEHTSELQSRRDLVCRLLLEKKKRQSQFTSH